MRKYIIVGVSFFTFALISGCAKSEEDKCKNKGWYWNESTKQCTETAPEGEVAAPATETKESCKAKAGYIWDTQNSQCKKLNYFMLIHPEDSNLRNVYVALKRGSQASRMDELVYLKEGKCVKVSESYLPNLLVSVQVSYWSAKWNEVCNNLAGSEKKCELGVYEVKLVDDNVSFQAIAPDVERTDCQLLEMAN